MDFFERQDVARKKTKILVFYFALAVIGIIAAIYTLVVIGLGIADSKSNRGGYDPYGPSPTSAVSHTGYWQPEVLLYTALVGLGPYGS